jgi:hypothetical protein
MDLLAVSTPGMRWIPVFMLLTAIGWLSGIVALICIRRSPKTARLWGWITVCFATVATVVLWLLAGRHLIGLAFFIMATPLIAGVPATFADDEQPREPRGFDVVPQNAPSGED